MAISTTKVLRLTFNTAGNKTFVITVPNPQEDMKMEDALVVMNFADRKRYILNAQWGLNGDTGYKGH